MGLCCTSSKDFDNYHSRSMRKKDKDKLKNQIKDMKGYHKSDNVSKETETNQKVVDKDHNQEQPSTIN